MSQVAITLLYVISVHRAPGQNPLSQLTNLSYENGMEWNFFRFDNVRTRYYVYVMQLKIHVSS